MFIASSSRSFNLSVEVLEIRNIRIYSILLDKILTLILNAII
jgi:hypothetical protein